MTWQHRTPTANRASGGGITGISVDVPAGIAVGDGVFTTFFGNTGTMTPPAGHVLVAEAFSCQLWFKPATGLESGTFDWAWTSAVNNIAIICHVAYEDGGGVVRLAAFGGNQTASGTSHAFTGIAVPNNNSLLVLAVAMSPGANAVTWTATGGLTKRGDEQGITTTAGVSSGLFTETQAVAGASGDKTVESSFSAAARGVLAAFTTDEATGYPNLLLLGVG